MSDCIEQINKYELIKRTLVCLESGIPIPNECSQWLITGFQQYLTENEKLDIALGLVNIKKEARNFHISSAGKHIYPSTESLWSCANELQKHVLRFETTKWKNIKHLSLPPNNLTLIQKELFLAFKVGISLPNNRRQYWNILKKNMV